MQYGVVYPHTKYKYFANFIDVIIIYTALVSESDVNLNLEEVTEPFRLGIYLDIKPHVLKTIEKDCPQNTKKQKIEVINYWLRNGKKCSWETIAKALEQMGDYGELVTQIRKKYLNATV